MKTFIPGKDAALEDSISFFEQQLKKLDLEIEVASWLNPVPHVWSVHIRDKQCPLCFSNGKGASKKAALASALGEYFERLSTNYYFADFYLGQQIADSSFVHYPNEKWFPLTDDNKIPDDLLDPYLRAFYDPDDNLSADMLIDLQSGAENRGICALPFIRQSDQKTVFIPVNIIGNLYVSNGMSAGNTRAEANVQAMSEIFERFVKNRIIAEAISLPLIPDSVLLRYPSICEAINTLQQQGFPIRCYDASLGGQFPVICVVLFNPQNGGCFASFGAHPDFGVALERSVTELLQGRSLLDLDIFPSPGFDNEEIAEHANLETHFIDSSGIISWDLFCEKADYPFTDWSFSGSTTNEFDTLLNLFRQHHKDVYIADYQHLGVHACRILVPGMSEIYPVDDLLYANNTMAVYLRDTILSLPESTFSTEYYLELLNQLDEEGLDDFIRIRELFGIATESDNGWHTLRIGELKALLALAGGDLEQALIWTEWTIEFNELNFTPHRLKFYRCLYTLLQFATSRDVSKFSDYYSAFKAMYGEEAVIQAWSHIQQKQFFYDLFKIDKNLQPLKAHQDLLAIYEKLQRAKQKFWPEFGNNL